MANVVLSYQDRKFTISADSITGFAQDLRISDAATPQSQWYLCITPEGPMSAYSVLGDIPAPKVSNGVFVASGQSQFVILADSWSDQPSDQDVPALNVQHILEIQ